jgi:predicted ribosome quality control (RQC) complex YloA/Tae2 family protein
MEAFRRLILANLSDAVRLDGKILVVDYFDENVPTVEIEADENDSLTEAAEKFFRRYTKARMRKNEISIRLEILMNELDELNLKKARLDEAIAEKDDSVIDEFTTVKIEKLPGKQREKHADNSRGRVVLRQAKATKYWSEKHRRTMIF